MNVHEYRQSAKYAEVMRGCIDSVQYFMRLCYPHAFTLPSAPHHLEFDRLSKDFSLKHAVIEVFRESGKSTYFGGGLPLWHRFCEPFRRAGFYPKTFEETEAFLQKTSPTFVVIQSKSGREARRRLRSIKTPLGAAPTQKREALEGRRNFEVHFGTRITTTTNTQYELHLSDGSIFMSLGGKQQGHGLQEDYVRPTLAINDDPETEENTKTEASTQANYDTFMNGIYAGLGPSGRAYTLATPINTHCMVRRLKRLALAGMPGWEYFHFPFVKYRASGEPYSVWPEKKSVRELLDEKQAMEADGTVYLWYLKYQCQIRSRETQLFKPEDIMLYEGELEYDRSGHAYLRITHLGPHDERAQGSPYRLDEAELVPVNLFTGHDPSHGVGGDDAVKLTRAFDGERHFVHHILARNDTDTYGQCLWILRGGYERGADDLERGEADSEFVPGYKQMKEQSIIVEGTFFEKAMQRPMNESRQEEKLYPPIIPVSPGTAKDKRYVSDIVKDFRQRRVYFRSPYEHAVQVFLGFNTMQADQEDDEIDGYWLSRRQNWKPSHTLKMLEAKPDATRRKKPQKRDWRQWAPRKPEPVYDY